MTITKNHIYDELIGNFDKLESIGMNDHSDTYLKIDENSNHIQSFKYNNDILFRRGHRNCATCIDAKMTSKGPRCATGGKDCTILSWDLNTLKIINSLKGTRNDYLRSNLPTSNISSVLVSENVFYSGCFDGKIIIWDIRNSRSTSFIAHKGYISGICRCDTPTDELVDNIDIYGEIKQLDYDNYIYSSGHDGIIFQWDLRNTNVHLNESKGHVGGINQMISLGRDKLLTTGSDRTTRLWSINSNTHHIYNGGGECCILIGKRHFISGDDQGNIYLYQKGKKSPIKKLQVGKWVTALGFANEKLVFGTVNDDKNKINYCNINEDSNMNFDINSDTINGTINGIKILGNVAFSIIGTNHKFGRWFKETGKNGILVTNLI